MASVDLKTHSIAGEEQHTDEHIVGYYNTGDRMKRWGKVGAVRRWWLDRVAGLEGAAVVGGLGAIGGGLASIGIPRDSIVEYELALKTDKFVHIVHGTQDAVAKAKGIIETAPAIHADADGFLFQPLGEGRTGPLAALVGVEDFRFSISQKLLGVGQNKLPKWATSECQNQPCQAWRCELVLLY